MVQAPQKLPVSVAERFARSDTFQEFYDDGLSLAEETRDYLEGPGRWDCRALPNDAALAYAGESMRHTTRVMQAMSWLLAQRAVREGEIRATDAAQPKFRLGDDVRSTPSINDGALPPRLQGLLARGRRLYADVARWDATLYGEMVDARTLQARLTRAFDADDVPSV